jgi:hypothetical protein
MVTAISQRYYFTGNAGNIRRGAASERVLVGCARI